MPRYEYQCKACGHVFEREHAIGQKKQYRCPDCSSKRTQKIISQVGVVFKGSGFYITDNRKGNGCKTNAKTVKHKSSGSNGSANKSDSKENVKTSELASESNPVSEN